MRIVLVSRSWPNSDRSGVPLSAALHANMLVELGHHVAIVGADIAVLAESARCHERHFIAAEGSGALYAPVKIDRREIAEILAEFRPDLAIVEAWQTALTDTFVDVAHQAQVPVLMISHGVSVTPFSRHWMDWVRSLGWQYYRWVRLPSLVGKLSAMTSLSLSSRSLRFIDRDMAVRKGVPVMPLGNPPVNWNDGFVPREARKSEVLVVGYYSRVKNQLAALEVALALRDVPIRFKFLGARSGGYYRRCVRFVQRHGLGEKIDFLEDGECDIAEAVGASLVVLSTSITEALPIALIEAMASGTPFIATAVGAVPGLRGGVMAESTHERARQLLRLAEDNVWWNRLSDDGRAHFEQSFAYEKVRDELARAVSVAAARNSVG